MRTCKRCNQSKPLGAFREAPGNANKAGRLLIYRRGTCRACEASQWEAWKAQKIKAAMKAAAEAYPRVGAHQLTLDLWRGDEARS